MNRVVNSRFRSLGRISRRRVAYWASMTTTKSEQAKSHHLSFLASMNMTVISLRRVVAPVILSLLVTVVASCGGAGSGESTPEPTDLLPLPEPLNRLPTPQTFQPFTPPHRNVVKQKYRTHMLFPNQPTLGLINADETYAGANKSGIYADR